jgi:hypothetical protein
LGRAVSVVGLAGGLAGLAALLVIVSVVLLSREVSISPTRRRRC